MIIHMHDSQIITSGNPTITNDIVNKQKFPMPDYKFQNIILLLLIRSKRAKQKKKL